MKKVRYQIGVCEYHLCENNKKTKLLRCSYCKRYYCQLHKRPKPAGTPKFRDTSWEAKEFMELYRSPWGHPCYPYNRIWWARIHQQRRYDKALGELTTRKKSIIDLTKLFEKTEAKKLEEQRQKEIVERKRIEEDKIKQIEEVLRRQEEQEIIEQRRRKRLEKEEAERRAKREASEHKGDYKPPSEPIKETDPEDSKPSIRKKVVITTILILIIAILSYYVYPNFQKIGEDIKSELSNKNKTGTIFEAVSVNYSFSEILNNTQTYSNRSITLTGYLKYKLIGTTQEGYYSELLIDDFGNEISLKNLNRAQKMLFTKNQTSKEVYNVTGILRFRRKNIEFQVIKITQINKIYINTLENIEEENTVLLETTEPHEGLFDSIKSLFTKIFHKDIVVYNNCSDGTIHSKCSYNKPFQCINGSLIENSNVCGCSEDYDAIGNSCKKIQKCNDGTKYGQCSKDKPYFCDNGVLIKRIEECGCNWNYKEYKGDCVNVDKAEAMEAIDYLNQLRKQYGRNELKWNDNLYNLGMYRVKDMYERKYFDHVTPDGKCVKDFKENYELEDYNIAENGGAVTYSSSMGSGAVDYAPYANPKEQIDSWMESRGHRYNLLYPAHIFGIVACYKGACVFLGANKEYYGLGYGPCITGEEGLEYWQNVEKQPGEI